MSNSKKYIIVEDERLAADKLELLIRKVDPSLELVGKLPSVKRSVQWLQSNSMPDLIFMDIQLEDGLSFAIFDQIEIPAPVIFTTAYDEYTIRAFKVNSVDYLLKPVQIEDLKHSIAKYRKLHDQSDIPDIKKLIKQIMPSTECYKSRFSIQQGSELLMIDIDDVAYFYAEDKYCYLITQNDHKYIIDFTLEKLEKVLNPHEFFRINRQYIVSLQAISKMERYSASKLRLFLKPKVEDAVFVSLSKYSAFKQWLNE